MSLEDLNESDIETLRQILKLSGRVATDRRRALCIEIGINPGELTAIWMVPENDFAVELIDLLLNRKLEIATCKLCEELKSSFRKGGYAPKLDAIIDKLNRDLNLELGDLVSTSQPSTEDLHRPTQQVTENLASQPKLAKLIGQLRYLSLNGFSIRKMLVVSLTITGVLVGLRFFNLLEWLELKAYDHLMQSRLLFEKEDPRLLIIKITDEDILAQDKRGEKGYGNSLRDPSLNRLLQILEQHQPRLIGLDLYRTFPADSSVPGLAERLKQKQIVAVCKVPKTDEQGNQIGSGLAPPQEVTSFGFSDFITDRDDTLRRHLMAQDQLPGAECGTTESFSLSLARHYLEQELGSSVNYRDPIKSGENLRLGGVVFQQLQPFTVGYQDVDNSGFQILLNYRVTTSGNVAKVLTLEEVLNNKNNKFSDEDIRNKIVLIGSYAYQEGPRDEWSTPYGTMNGVTVHAHMVSQILSTVLDGRPLLRVFPQGVEIFWIWLWSGIGGVFTCYWRAFKPLGIAIGCGVIVLYITCWASLTFTSLWIPLIPPALALISTGITVIYISSFYRT